MNSTNGVRAYLRQGNGSGLLFDGQKLAFVKLREAQFVAFEEGEVVDRTSSAKSDSKLLADYRRLRYYIGVTAVLPSSVYLRFFPPHIQRRTTVAHPNQVVVRYAPYTRTIVKVAS